MNSEELLRFLIKNGIKWVVSQRNLHRPSARKLTEAEIARFFFFFEPRILDLARIKIFPCIRNPGFYSKLEDMKLTGLPDFTTAAGITFIDTILISEQGLEAHSALGPLIFHELVHVVQYDVLGVDEFIKCYVQGWARGGFDYYSIPLEMESYNLQRRYEKDSRQGFPVLAEVCKTLGEE